MKIMTTVLVLALAVATPMLAQNTQPPAQTDPGMGQQPDQSSSQPMQQPNTSQPAQTQPDQSPGSSVSGANPQSSQTLSGTISADGKTLTSNGTTYSISNPNSVKPFANQPVTVAYDLDTNNSIHINRVMLTHPQQ